MKKRIICLLALASSLSGYSAEIKDTTWPLVTKETKPWTRWWWLGNAVDKPNLTYNLEELSKAGIGGVEITPIYGVKGDDSKYIDYLSPQWMSMLSHTETESKRLGMQVDMNTGTGWPFGGPEVTVADAATKAIFQEYQLKGGEKLNQKILVEDNAQKDVATLSILMAFSDKGKRLDITSKVTKDGTLLWTSPKGNWKLIALFVGKTLQKVKRAAPGGQGYVMNHLDAGSVGRYLGKFDKAFSRDNSFFPHSFFNDSYEVYGANWSPTLLEEFQKRRGYKLEEYLPELLADGKTEQSARVISDYRETVGDMLMDNFTKPWTAWAHSHGATTRNQAHGSPANLIDLYAAVDIPECETFGISNFDIPGLRKDSLIKLNDGDPVTLKYATSAAHIAGKKYASSETFTWLTEHFRTSLSQCKPEIDQMFTSGVNHVYFQGTPYSPKEAAWPGWLFYASVNMSPTNSIWKDAPAFFNYITRSQSFLQYGQPDNDLLVYLPIYDIWEELRGDYYLSFAIHGMRNRLPKFYKAIEKIRESGADVDYISDRFIMTSTVENGLLKTSGGTTYKALVLPAAKLLPLETLKKLLQLANEGAKIMFVDQYPADVPGLNKLEQRRLEFKKTLSLLPKINSFAQTEKNKVGKGSIITGSDYESLLAAGLVSGEPFIKDFGGQCIRRKNETGFHYFFAMLNNRPVDGWVPIEVNARSAMFFNPMDGTSGKAFLRINNGKTEVYMQLSPGESLILKTFTHDDVNVPAWTYYESAKKNVELKDGWELCFTQSEPVVEGKFSLTSLGSWTDLPAENVSRNMGTARYSIKFNMKELNALEYQLDLGDVRESARVYVNGKEVTTLFAVPFKTYIGKYLKEGENLLEVEVTNLPANRIADYDKRGVNWRIFNEINFVNVNYKDSHYDNWKPVPSGLLGPVRILEMEEKKL